MVALATTDMKTRDGYISNSLTQEQSLWPCFFIGNRNNLWKLGRSKNQKLEIVSMLGDYEKPKPRIQQKIAWNSRHTYVV